MSFVQNHLARLLAEWYRTRSSWNDRLTHWERPASESEEVQIERAASMVRSAVAENAWLRNEGVAVSAQGSYFNKTNVRLESDMDLRAVHPLIRIEYAPNVLVEAPRPLITYPRAAVTSATLSPMCGARSSCALGRNSARRMLMGREQGDPVEEVAGEPR